jgi:hypothetical protein
MHHWGSALGPSRELRIIRRVRASLAKLPLKPKDVPDGFSPNGGALAETGFTRGDTVQVRGVLTKNYFTTPERKVSGNDKYGTGSLVTCEGKVAFERR